MPKGIFLFLAGPVRSKINAKRLDFYLSLCYNISITKGGNKMKRPYTIINKHTGEIVGFADTNRSANFEVLIQTLQGDFSAQDFNIIPTMY